MNQETVKQQLQALKMFTAASELEPVLNAQKKTVHFAWLSALLEREIDARKERALSCRIKRAEFPEVTSIEAFDWAFNPDIDEAKIKELATLSFVEKHQIALFLGKPGTGKTHLALAIGVKAAQAGFRVYCSSLKKLAFQILQARSRNSLDLLFKRILSAHLWIVDDWAVVSLRQEIAEEVFDLLDRRRHSTALILTSNRDVDEWSSVFPEPVIAAASIDRLFDRAEIVAFNGKSYRLKNKINFSEVDLEKQNGL
jgi:DNA replication protein DnaC